MVVIKVYTRLNYIRAYTLSFSCGNSMYSVKAYTCYTVSVSHQSAYRVYGQKRGHFVLRPDNFRNIEQIFTKFGKNQSRFILNIIRVNQF